MAAQLPEQMPHYMELKQQQLDDPATLALYRDLAAAIEWEPADPRLATLADRLVSLLEAADPKGWEDYDEQMNDELIGLLDSTFLDSVPAARRLTELLEERGWGGWTKFERIGERPL